MLELHGLQEKARQTAEWIVARYPNMSLENTELDISLKEALEINMENSSRSSVQLYRSIQGMMVTWFERGMSIVLNGTEYEFLKCNKTILVDTSQELEAAFVKIKKLVQTNPLGANLALHIGQDRILKKRWLIDIPASRWDNGLLARRMSGLLSSGIYNQFKQMKRVGVVRYHGRIRQEKISKQPIPLNLDTNILTLFVIYGICIQLSILWLGWECFSSVHSTLFSCFGNV